MKYFLIAVVFIMGCNSEDWDTDAPPVYDWGVYPVCRNYVEFHYNTIADHEPEIEKRIAYGGKNGRKHVQLQVLIDGEWVWVTHYPKDITIMTGNMDSNFKPDEYATLEAAKENGWIK